jgi:hypothetical protein
MLDCMTDDLNRLNWHPIEEPAAEQLIAQTNSPGLVYGFRTSDLPAQLQKLPNPCSYYISGYMNTVPGPRGISVGGEILVARTDGDLTKNYQYVFGTSSGGQVVFAGPFKDFEGHHVRSGQQFAVSSMFNHTPFSPKT